MSAECELNHVHHQRLRAAVDAARAGARIEFRVKAGDPSTIVWIDLAAQRSSHTIMSLYGQKEPWMAAIRAAFAAALSK